MIVFGVILTSANSDIVEFTKQYDDSCEVNKICPVDISIDTKMPGPVYFYYAIDNFYQNHRRYIKSRSDSQLAGTSLSADEVSSSCNPIVRNKDLGAERTKALDGVTTLDPDAAAHPCGLIAWSVFNGNKNIFIFLTPHRYLHYVGS